MGTVGEMVHLESGSEPSHELEREPTLELRVRVRVRVSVGVRVTVRVEVRGGSNDAPRYAGLQLRVGLGTVRLWRGVPSVGTPMLTILMLA